MPFPNVPKDAGAIPISSNYVPDVGFKALQGSPNVKTDGLGNDSAPAAVALAASITAAGILQNAQTGNAVGTPLSLLGMASVVFTVNMSAFTGTVNFEGTEDGTNYDPVWATQSGTNTLATTVVGAVTTAIHVYEATCLGRVSVQARTSGVTAGSVTVTAHALPINMAPRVLNIANFPATQPVSGTVQANAGTNLNTAALALEAGGNLAQLVANTGSADVILLASGARTTTQTSADLTNSGGSGIRVTLDMTVVTAGPSVTLSINAKDTASGKYVALLTGLAVTTVSTNVYKIYPTLVASANAIAQDVLPHTFQIVVSVGNANSGTYSVGYSILQ